MAFSQKIWEQVMAEVIDGMSPPKVARQYGVHHTTVHRWAVAAGWTFAPGARCIYCPYGTSWAGARDRLPVAEVARRMSVVPQTIRTWHGKMSMTILRRGRDGGATTTGRSIVGTTAPAGTTGTGRRLCLVEGASAAVIAAVLDRPLRTIAREINRSSSADTYGFPAVGEYLAGIRRAPVGRTSRTRSGDGGPPRRGHR